MSFSGCVFFATCNEGFEVLRTLSKNKVPRDEWIGSSASVVSAASGIEKAFLSRWEDIILMDTLSPVDVATVAMIDIMKYWNEHGIEVVFTEPQLIAEIVKKNRTFQEYGVRQLHNFIRSESDDAIEIAKKLGLTSVHLTLDEKNKFQIKKPKEVA